MKSILFLAKELGKYSGNLDLEYDVVFDDDIMTDDATILQQYRLDAMDGLIPEYMYIMKAYEEDNILDNVNKQSNTLVHGLSDIDGILNLRNCGLIIGFDLPNSQKRDILVEKLYKNGLICNKTGVRSIRLRPNLNLNENEVDHALQIFKGTMEQC